MKQLAHWHALNEIRRWSKRNGKWRPFWSKRAYVLLLSVTGIMSSLLGASPGGADRALRIRHRTERNKLVLNPFVIKATKSIETAAMAKRAAIVACEARLASLVRPNLIKCHTYYRGLAASVEDQKIATVWTKQCRIANRFQRNGFRRSSAVVS